MVGFRRKLAAGDVSLQASPLFPAPPPLHLRPCDIPTETLPAGARPKGSPDRLDRPLVAGIPGSQTLRGKNQIPFRHRLFAAGPEAARGVLFRSIARPCRCAPISENDFELFHSGDAQLDIRNLRDRGNDCGEIICGPCRFVFATTRQNGQNTKATGHDCAVDEQLVEGFIHRNGFQSL